MMFFGQSEKDAKKAMWRSRLRTATGVAFLVVVGLLLAFILQVIDHLRLEP